MRFLVKVSPILILVIAGYLLLRILPPLIKLEIMPYAFPAS
jgi:hypothetical protein